MPRILACVLLPVALASTAVYWIPGLDFIVYKYVRLGLLATTLGVILTAVVFGPRHPFIDRSSKVQLVGIFGIFLCVLGAIPAAVKSAPSDTISAIAEVALPILLFLLIRRLFVSLPVTIKFATGGSYIILLAVTLQLLAYGGLIPNFKVPIQLFWLSDYNMYSLQGFTLAASGLHAVRTGWSSSLVSFLALALIFNRLQFRSVGVRRMLDLLMFLVVIASQFTVGGRGGILGSVLIWLIYILVEYGFIVSALSFIGLGIGSVLLISPLADQLRLSGAVGGDLDAASSGRLTLLRLGWDQFIRNPVSGAGFGQAGAFEFAGRVRLQEVHLVWLRMAAAGGLAFVLPTIAIMMALFQRSIIAIFSAARSRVRAPASQIMAVAGSATVGMFIQTLTEPRAIFGSPLSSLGYWTCMAILFAISDLGRARMSADKGRDPWVGQHRSMQR